MTATSESPVRRAEGWALELLDNQPEPVVFYLPLRRALDDENVITDFEVAYANKEAVGRFNVAEGQCVSEHTFLDYTESAMKAVWLNQLLHVFNSGEQTTRRYYKRQTGEHFNLLCKRVGEGVLTMARDITREVQAKLEKEQQADFTTAILNTTINGLFAVEAERDASGAITDFLFVKANEPFARLIGRKQEEIIGKSYADLLPLSKGNGLFDLKCRVIETGETIIKEFFYEGGGIDRWYLISISRLGTNGIVESFTDITESKRDKEEAERMAQRFQTVVSTTHSGIQTFRPVRDDRNEIVDFEMNIVNQTIATYIGETAEQLSGKLASVYFPAYKHNGLFEIYRDCYLNGTRSQFDFHYEDGYDVFFNLQVAKMGDEILVSLVDHTTLKRTQRELEQSINELRRSNASLEQFAHAASHDLQEPLRKISVYAERLEQGYGTALDDTGFGYLERIQTAARRMRRLIQDLLVFAEVGANEQDWETVDLNRIVSETLTDLEVAIAERDATVNVGHLGQVRGDVVHLQQLFQNLIGNSLKYSRPEVPPFIRINAGICEGKDTGFSLAPHEMTQRFCRIELKDNGQGFTKEQATQIFKIFQRLPQHRAEHQGTGIGLAIVQRVIENHKGYIWAEGEPGVGAVFTILLPAL